MGRPKGSKNGQRTLIEFTCERCDKVFSVRPSAAPHTRFCSMACYKPPGKIVTCETCGKSYTLLPSERGRFCSNKCKQNRVQKHCPQCDKDFSVRASKADRYTYCSIECSRAAGGDVALNCGQCGNQFFVNRARITTAKFCSRECAKAAKPEQTATITCEQCGKERTMPSYRIEKEGARFCSNRCSTIFRMENGYETGYIAIKRQNGYRTDIEALTEKVMIELGVKYIFEHKIGRFSVDFSIPAWGVALECDGWQHLRDKDIERDAKRTEYLNERGWKVIRVMDKDIRIDAATAIKTALHDYLNP